MFKLTKKLGFLFIVIILLILILFYFYWDKFELVAAKIDNEKIYLSDYKTYIKSLTNFYNLQKTALSKDASMYRKFNNQFQENLEKGVLQEMIENKIIELELKNQFNISNLNEIAEQKINKALSESKDIAKNVKFLYNLDLENFKKLFLYPVALKEILNDELKKTNIKDLDQWFLGVKQKYNVKVYINNLKWKKEKGIVE